MANGPDTSASQFSADWLVAGFAEGNSREPSSECRDGPWSIPTVGAGMFALGHSRKQMWPQVKAQV